MAKTGITEEQLSASLQRVGGLGALKENAGGARRDSPFGSSYTRQSPERPAITRPAETPPTSLPDSPPTASPPPVFPAARSGPPSPPGGESVTASSARVWASSQSQPVHRDLPPAVSPAAPALDPAPRSNRPEMSPRTPSERAQASGRIVLPLPDISPEEEGMEKVTVLMSPYMRDSVSILARKLQRRRTQKEFRFTANTVFRAAIQLALDTFQLESEDRINSEEELLARMKERLRRDPW